MVEVLSLTTEEHDRGDRLESYQRLPSVREVLFVSLHPPSAEVRRRTRDGWEIHSAEAGETSELTSIKCRLEIDGLFHNPLAR